MQNINIEDFETLLNNLCACSPAKEWAKGKDLATVWATCERGDWMLWLLEKMAEKPGWLTRKQVVGIACDCAETALKYVKPDETRPAECIAAVRKWIAGEATIEDVRKARRASAYAAYAAAAAAAAAAYAADAAYDAAAYAATAATYAAYAADAYAAADADAAAYARKTAFKLSADICRKNFIIE
jgi:hypothetical protein